MYYLPVTVTVSLIVFTSNIVFELDYTLNYGNIFWVFTICKYP